MRYHITFIVVVLHFFALISCKSSPTKFATQWSSEIKEKIIADANHQYDSTSFDSTYYNLTLFNGGKKLKYFSFRPVLDTINRVILSIDTLVSISYSTDQKFELIRELCPGSDRSFEGIKYSGVGHLGLTEFRFCDGKIKTRGFRYGSNVGVWIEYDSTGKVIEQKDNGNIELLNNLHDIKYYR